MNQDPQDAHPPARRTIRRRSLHEEAAALLREMILEGTLAPGERIAELVLCDELGISRTPLREAIKVLASEGLVRLMPNQGAVVTEITAADVVAMFEMMEALEVQVGRLAAARISDDYLTDLCARHEHMLRVHAEGRRAEYFATNQDIHLMLARASGNAYLAADYERYQHRIRRARYLANLRQSRWDESVREHEQIIAALIARDGPHLGELLAEHSRRTGAIVIAAVEARVAGPS